jgi:general stress protein 26
MNKDKIYQFIKSEKYAVISSINNASHPESALVAFSEKEELEIIFASNDSSRKIQNILLNPNVSLVIGFGKDHLTSVQIEGTARILKLEDAEEYVELHTQKQPEFKELIHNEGECVVVLTPFWARYTNYSSKTPEIFEEYYGAD